MTKASQHHLAVNIKSSTRHSNITYFNNEIKLHSSDVYLDSGLHE